MYIPTWLVWLGIVYGACILIGRLERRMWQEFFRKQREQ